MFCCTHSPYSSFSPLSIFGGWSCGCGGVEKRQAQHLLTVNWELLFWDTSNSLSYRCHSGGEIRVGLWKWKNSALSLEIRDFNCNSCAPAISDGEHGFIKRNSGYSVLPSNIQLSPFKAFCNYFSHFYIWTSGILQCSKAHFSASISKSFSKIRRFSCTFFHTQHPSFTIY